MVSNENNKWFKEWITNVVAQLAETKHDVKQLVDNQSQQKQVHTSCREEMLKLLSAEKLDTTKSIHDIQQLLTSTALWVKLYFGLYTALLTALGAALWKHITKE